MGETISFNGTLSIAFGAAGVVSGAAGTALGGPAAGRWHSRGCLSGRPFFKLETEPFLFDLEDRKVMLLHQIDDGFNFFEVFRIQALFLWLRLSV